MAAIEKDVRFLEAALPELKDYLFSKELYWPLPAVSGIGQLADFIRLTPGNLLLSKARLKAKTISPEEEQLLSKLDEICSYWRSHWFQKIEKEIPARLTLWNNDLVEAREDGFSLASYRYQIRIRVMLELLTAELAAMPLAYQKQIPALDQLLREITSPGPFIWETEVMRAFPEHDYWFLYRIPKEGA